MPDRRSGRLGGGNGRPTAPVQCGNSTLRQWGTSTFGPFRSTGPGGYVRGPPREGPHLAGTRQGTPTMTTLKWYAQRATMLLGTFAAFVVVINGAKRW